jgi:hypothetical protein
MMFDIEESASNILQKIYVLRTAFRKELGYLPNSVILGCNEYYTLLRSRKVNIYPKSNGQFQCFGMDIERSTKDNYLAVGWIMINELDKQNGEQVKK